MRITFRLTSSNLEKDCAALPLWCRPQVRESLKNEIKKGSKEAFFGDDNLEANLVQAFEGNYILFLNKREENPHEEKLKFLGELSTNLFHEINGPLNIMSSSVEILKMDSFSLTNPDEKETINNSVETLEIGLLRLLNIVRGIQGFAQGKHQYKIVDFNKFVSSTAEFSKVFLNKDHISIKVSSAIGDSIKAEMQDTLISQVLINLIKNSADAVREMPSFSRWVEIKLKEDDKDFIIDVIDSGRGLSEEAQGNLFKYGFSTKGAGAGHGIGLNFCKKVMEEHKGSINYDPTRGNTCFVLRLPKTKKVLK